MIVIKKNYFRKVAFGIGPEQSVPLDPVAWAKGQVHEVPTLAWDGPLPTGSEMMDHRASYRGNEDKLREKYKNDREAYKKAKSQLKEIQQAQNIRLKSQPCYALAYGSTS